MQARTLKSLASLSGPHASASTLGAAKIVRGNVGVGGTGALKQWTFTALALGPSSVSAAARPSADVTHAKDPGMTRRTASKGREL